jgi:hypothetical protein
VTAVAYTPKAGYTDLDALGTVFVNDSTTVNVRELVEGSPNGVFVVDDQATIARLDKYAPLKRTALAKAYEEPEQEPEKPPKPSAGRDKSKAEKDGEK